MHTVRLGLPLDVSGVVLVGIVAWALAVVAVVLIVLFVAALGSRADRRRRDIDIALAECLGLAGGAQAGSAPAGTAAGSGHVVRGHLVQGDGRVLTWRSSQLVPDERVVRDEVVDHMMYDARRELTTLGLVPAGEPLLESHPVVWVAAWPDAPTGTGTYVTGVTARAAGVREAPTLAMLSVTWPVAD